MRAGESDTSSTTVNEKAEGTEFRFEKRRTSKLGAVGCGLGLAIVAVIAFGLVLSAGTTEKIVGVVVLIVCLTVASVSVWARRSIASNDPLVIGENYLAFDGKKIHARDIVNVEVDQKGIRWDIEYYPLVISTNHGTEIVNLLGYGIKPDRVGEVADAIAESVRLGRIEGGEARSTPT
jgi:hypothetical protein